MENRINELRELGYEIESIIKGTTDPKVLSMFYRNSINRDIIIPQWTEDDIIRFSNLAYNIVTRTSNKKGIE